MNHRSVRRPWLENAALALVGFIVLMSMLLLRIF